MSGKEYSVVETKGGEGLVAVTPEGGLVPSISHEHPEPLPLEEAQVIVDGLNRSK